MIPDGCGRDNLAIEVSGRDATATSIHDGIETAVINNILYQENTLRQTNSIRDQF